MAIPQEPHENAPAERFGFSPGTVHGLDLPDSQAPSLGEQSKRLPELDQRERRQVDERVALRPLIVHEAIRAEGEAELSRPTSALAWSGLAAGLSMGFSFITEGVLRGHLPDAAWVPLVSKLGYSVGFLIVVLGRQQLFTENTITPILPLLVRRNASTFLQVLRLWTVVLATNLLGAAVIAFVLANVESFEPGVQRAFDLIGREAVGASFGSVVLRAIFAGWLIALMVWLLPAAETARFWVIVTITYVVGLGGFSHIIAGTVEVLYLVWSGVLSFGAFLDAFFLPTLLGNVIGGVSLVAVLNYAQVVAGEPKHERGKP